MNELEIALSKDNEYLSVYLGNVTEEDFRKEVIELLNKNADVAALKSKIIELVKSA